METQQTAKPCPDGRDDIEELVRAFENDALMALACLMDERKLLIHQLELTARAMGRGFVRGWIPSIVRNEDYEF